MLKQKILDRGKDFALDLFCENTNKPITTANKYGMYCSDMCGIEQDKDTRNAFRTKLEQIIKSLEW